MGDTFLVVCYYEKVYSFLRGVSSFSVYPELTLRVLT